MNSESVELKITISTRFKIIKIELKLINYEWLSCHRRSINSIKFGVFKFVKILAAVCSSKI